MLVPLAKFSYSFWEAFEGSGNKSPLGISKGMTNWNQHHT